MAINEFLPFGIATGSNVATQAEYAVLDARTGGFSSGVAPSDVCNKVWRQAAYIAAMIGQFSAERSGADMLDNGDLVTSQAIFLAALRAVVLEQVTAGNFATVPQLNAESSARGAAVSNEAVVRANQDGIEQAARIAADTNEAQARATADSNLLASVVDEQNTRFAQDQLLLTRFDLYALLSGFGASKTENGYQRFPNGTIIQWGRATTYTGYLDFFNLPIAFPNAMLSIVGTEAGVNTWGIVCNPTFIGLQIENNAQFIASTARLQEGNPQAFYQQGISLRYIAIGH